MQLPGRHFPPTTFREGLLQTPTTNHFETVPLYINLAMNENVDDVPQDPNGEIVTCAEELPHLDLQEYIYGTISCALNGRIEC